jgi:putative sigma-54 modulation protein
MTILFTGRKAHLTPALKTFAESKLVKLEKLLGDMLDAHVILKSEKHRQVAEVVVKARSRTLTAKAEAGEFTDAVSVCAERLLAQARKHADRMNSRRKGRGDKGLPWRRDGGASQPPLESSPTDGLPGVVRMGRTAVRPMSVREALLRAVDADRPVLVFRDAVSHQISVLFRRADGQFGLVETEV